MDKDVYGYKDKEGNVYEAELLGKGKNLFKKGGRQPSSDVVLHQLQKEIYDSSNEVCCLKKEPNEESFMPDR